MMEFARPIATTATMDYTEALDPPAAATVSTGSTTVTYQGQAIDLASPSTVFPTIVDAIRQ